MDEIWDFLLEISFPYLFPLRDCALSFRGGVSCLLFALKTHVMCFSAYSFSQKHTSCVFPLTFSLKNTLFSYVRIDQFPRWGFLLTFRPKNTRHVFFRLLFLSKTHFSPMYVSISFQGGVSRLLFALKTHVMCFSAYFFSQKHTFLLC